MSTDIRIDLHSHSTFSDGALTPDQLVERAAAAGLQWLALTDHDTLDGLAGAHSAALLHGIGLIDGVEISASWRSQTLHVLGLWVDPGSSQLRLNLAAQAQRRRERMRQMCARLDKLRLPGQALLQTVESQPGVPTRTHLAAALVAAGHAKTPAEAFRRYLAQGKPAYRSAQWPALAQVVEWIRSAGGKACLAHPLRYRVSSGARRQLVAEFAAMGGAGLEVVTGNNALQHIDTCATLAIQFNLAGSVGSDFHTPQHAWNPLGRLATLPAGVNPLWGSLGY